MEVYTVQKGDRSAQNYIYLKKHIKMFQRLQPSVVELEVLWKDLKIGIAPFLP